MITDWLLPRILQQGLLEGVPVALDIYGQHPDGAGRHSEDQHSHVHCLAAIQHRVYDGA
jgi:hypothetical protein